MDISVILCTWNNARRLAITLDHLGRCAIPSGVTWELILVNNNCSDETDQVAQSFASSLPLNLLHEPASGKSRALNLACKEAKGRLLVFIDDDTKPPKNWLQVYWQAFVSKPSGFFFGGPIESEFEGPPPDEALLQYGPGSVRGMDWGPTPRQLEAHDVVFLGANWACCAQAIRERDGFVEEQGVNAASRVISVGEETELMERLRHSGVTGWYLPAAKLRHLVPPEKTDLRHLAGRARAGAFCQACLTGRRLIGTRKWMGITVPCRVRLVLKWLRWLGYRAAGQPAHGPYLEWRWMLGAVQGLAQHKKMRPSTHDP